MTRENALERKAQANNYHNVKVNFKLSVVYG